MADARRTVILQSLRKDIQNRLKEEARANEPEKLTDRGKALERIRSQSGDRADSNLVGLTPRARQPERPRSLLDLMKERNELARETSLDKFITGAPLSSVDSSLVRNLLPKPEKPKTFAQLADESKTQALAESLKTQDADPSEIFSGIQKAFTGQKAKDTAAEAKAKTVDLNRAKSDIRRAMTRLTNLTTDLGQVISRDEMSPTQIQEISALTREIRVSQRVVDAREVEKFTISRPPENFRGRTATTSTGARYISDGKTWRRESK